MEKYLILSCADSNRYNAPTNHKNYANKHSTEYQFIIKENIKNPFFIKPYCIVEELNKDYTHVLCIDDDAFFIDDNWDYKTVFSNYKQDLIVTKGRNKKNGTTLFNAGIMFIRNTKRMKKLFKLAPLVTDKELKSNWQQEWGPLVGNEQPRLIYLSQTLFPNSIKIIDYPGFNQSEVDFHKRKYTINKSPIVHFTGKNKMSKIERFKKDTGINLL